MGFGCGELWQGIAGLHASRISSFPFHLPALLSILFGFHWCYFFPLGSRELRGQQPPVPQTRQIPQPHTPQRRGSEGSETGANLSEIRDPFAAVLVPTFIFFPFIDPFRPGFSSFSHPSGITNCRSFSLVLFWERFAGGVLHRGAENGKEKETSRRSKQEKRNKNQRQIKTK